MNLAATQREWAGMHSGLRRNIKLLEAFSMLEVMVATSILMVILVVIFSVTQQISGAWKNSSAKIEAFQAGRAAFDSMTRQISLATLNTYYDYFDASGYSRGAVFKTSGSSGLANFVPARYGRYSDLNFVTGKSLVTGTDANSSQVGHAIFFTAPLGYTDDLANYGGMDTMLNACGYYVVYDKDGSRPKFLDDGTVPNKPADRYRFRLMQFLQPDQQLSIYNGSSSDWYAQPLASAAPPVRVMAENVVALVVLPKISSADATGATAATSLTTDYEYNTRPSTSSAMQGKTDYQLPPVVEVIMVVIDESSAQRLCTASGPPDFGIPGGVNSLFQSVSNLEDDLSKLVQYLRAKHINCRIFRSEIALRGAKWSS